MSLILSNFELFEELDTYLQNKGMCKVAITCSKTPVFLSYSIYGTGKKKVLFVMGLSSTGLYWAWQVKYFASLLDYQVCVFDNRGVGESSSPSGPYTTNMMALDTIELLNHLEWNENIHIVGVSMGAMICQMMALKRPGLFSSIVLTGCFNLALLATPTLCELKIGLKSLVLSNSALIKAKIKLNFPKPFLEETSSTGLTNYEVLNSFSETLNKRKSKDASQFMSILFHNILPSKLEKISQAGIRSLVLHGSKDKVIRSSHGASIADTLKCPLVLFYNSGHTIMIERAIEHNCLLRAHFENLDLHHYLNQTQIPKLSYITKTDAKHPLIFKCF